MKKQYKIAIGAAVSGALLLAGCDTALSGVDPRALSSAISELNDAAVSLGEQLDTLEIPAVGTAAPAIEAAVAPQPTDEAAVAEIPGIAVPEPSPEPTAAPTPKPSTKVTPKAAATPKPTIAPAGAKSSAQQPIAPSVKPAETAAPITARPSLAAAQDASQPPASQAAAPEKTMPVITIPPQPSETPVPMPSDLHIAGKDATLTINAEESVSAEPDIARVFLGVKAQGASASAAQDENNKLTQSFLDAIKAAGVADDDIETSNFNVYQDYDDKTIYYAETSYKVTIRDITKVGDVIDAAIQGGANNSYSLSFDVADRDALYIQALAKAVQAVQMKARTIAEAGGFTIKSTKSIAEGGTSAYYERGTAVEYAAADNGAGAAKMAVVPGDVKVSASVSGEFNIE